MDIRTRLYPLIHPPMTDCLPGSAVIRDLQGDDSLPLVAPRRTEILEEQQQGEPPRSERRRLLEIHTISRRIRIVQYRNDA